MCGNVHYVFTLWGEIMSSIPSFVVTGICAVSLFLLLIPGQFTAPATTAQNDAMNYIDKATNASIDNRIIIPVPLTDGIEIPFLGDLFAFIWNMALAIGATIYMVFSYIGIFTTVMSMLPAEIFGLFIILAVIGIPFTIINYIRLGRE